MTAAISFVLLILTSAYGQSCTWSSNGNDFDLSPLTVQQGGEDYVYVQSPYNYHWNYCGPTVSSGCNVLSGAWFTMFTSACTSLGAPTTMQFSLIDENKPETGVILQYTGTQACSGGTQNIGVQIFNYCDESEEFNAYSLTPYSSTNCLSVIEVKTKYACPSGKSSGGLSGGSIFLIIFFVSFFVYFAAGSGINFARGARGVEVVPNNVFWLALPKLVADGFRFVFGKITGRGSSTSTAAGNYSTL